MIALNDAPLSSIIEKFSASQLATKAAQTRKLYRIGFAHLDEYLGRPAMRSDMADTTVAPFLAWLRDAKDLDPVTVNARRDKLLTFWRWGFRKHHFADWPDVPKLAESEKIPRGYTVQQIRLLLHSAAQERGTIDGVPAFYFWPAIYWFWFHGGERSGATLKIRTRDVDWEAGEIDAPGSIRKTGKAERHVMGAAAMEAIRKIRTPARTLLFPWDRHIVTFYNHIKRICRRAGVPYRPPKAMRISFASHLEANGGNATEALQHSSRAVTRKSYLDPSIVKRPRACDKLPEV